MRITEASIVSDKTNVYAIQNPDGTWLVMEDPRLIGRTLDRNAAITAVTLAELETESDPRPNVQASIHSFRQELGLE